VKKNGKALQREQNETVRITVRKLVDRDFGGKAVVAARTFGISQPSLSNFLAGKTGAGIRLLISFAHYAGISLDELIQGRIGTKKSLGSEPPIRQAIEKLRGVVAADALSYLEKTAKAGAEVLTVAEWLEDGLAYHRKLKGRKRTTKR
jgi:transcriptional regulator with XRE-family HTH domain